MTRRDLSRLAGTIAILFLWTPSDAQRLAYTPGEVIVRLRAAAARPTAGALQDLAERYRVDSSTPLPVGSSSTEASKPATGGSQAFLLRYAVPEDARVVARAYAADPSVAYAEPNYLFRPAVAPNDPRYGDQAYLQTIGFETLRDGLGPKQRDVVLAVIDSGIDIEHPDLAGAILVNQAEANGLAGVDDDGNGYIDDVRGWDFSHAPGLAGKGDWLDPDNEVTDESGHGTQVAGVALAVTDNGIGVAGVSDALLLPIRAGVDLQSGESLFEEDDLASAIVYAADNGAHVINLSWGGPENAWLIRDAIRYAVAKGVLVVASAGNVGADGVLYPGRLDETLTVGATDNSDNPAGFSSRGTPVDLVAPGVSLLNTIPGASYASRSGTSFSAPIVSGVAALLLSRDASLQAEAVAGMLVSGTVDRGGSGWDVRFGNGRIDGAALLDARSAFAWGRIDAPQTDASASDTFEIRARTSSTGLTGWRLSWGEGGDPSSWNTLAEGGASASIEQAWDVSSLPPGVVVLRLEVDALNGRVLEDRVELRVSEAGPVITATDVAPLYDGRRPTHRVSWETDVVAEGAVILTTLDGTIADTVRTPYIHTRQRVLLPDNLSPGDRTVRILSTATDGAESTFDLDPVSIINDPVPGHGFEDVGRLPHGFLGDRVADFNQNDRPDVSLMPYIDGVPFNVTQIFELEDTGGYDAIYTSIEAYLPWNVGDADNDEAPDIVGTGVAQVRVFTGQPFPTTAVLDMSSTWGGELADADDDGRTEIVARASTNRRLLLLENAGSGFAEEHEIDDPTGGGGAFGARFVVADLDGDSNTEILVGDADGDLWIAEWNGSEFTTPWILEGDGDARWVGGGSDLDGDGQAEFGVLRAREDFDDLLNGYWELEVYGAAGNDAFELEYRTGVAGVITTGNGISTGDLDGDGVDELVVCARPDLYVIRYANGAYAPSWHAAAALLHRPLVADVDGDGAVEIAFNAPASVGDSVRIVRRQAVAPSLPAFAEAVVVRPNLVRLSWTPVPDALGYDVSRSSGQTSDTIARDLASTQVEDTGVEAGTAYSYRVIARLAGADSAVSESVTLVPADPPTVERLDSPADGRLRLRYSRTMAQSAFDVGRYRLQPAGIAPTSAVPGAAFREVLLTFDAGLGSGGFSDLTIRDVADTARVLLGEGSAAVSFLNESTGPVLPRRADYDGDGRIAFGDFLVFAGAFGKEDTGVDLTGDGRVTFSDFLLFATLFGRTV